MRRRTFLKLAAALTAATGWSRRATASESGLHVVVVGTGPAGFSAALELIERGVAVTLLEANEQLGGKVKGWTEPLNDTEVDVEHGVHGFAEGYVHFTDLLERYGLGEVLFEPPSSEAGVRFPGKKMGFRLGQRSRDLVRFSKQRARDLGYTRFTRDYLRGRKWVKNLTRESARAALGGRSVADFYASGEAPLTRYRLMPRVSALSLYFVEPEQLDAGMFAISERWNGVKVRWMRGNPGPLIWTPLAAAFTEQGGTLRTSAAVERLLVGEDGRVTGVELGTSGGEPVLIGPPSAWTATDTPFGRVLVGQNNGVPTAFSARCTHAGCPVAPSPAGFACPCHGGTYSHEGAVTGGPPKAPLPAVKVEVTEEGWLLHPPRTLERVEADAVVLAVGPEAFAKLASPLLPSAAGLKACQHSVARFWFDRDVAPNDEMAVLIGDYRHSSNGFLLHRSQDASRAWAEQTGGSVIEIQAFKDIPETLSNEALLEGIEADVREIWPELAEAKLLKHTLARGREFTWFYPGWHEHAPTVDTGVPGLFAAGDFLLVSRDCEFMERSVMTGRMAANHILTSAGLPTAPILPPVGLEARHP